MYGNILIYPGGLRFSLTNLNLRIIKLSKKKKFGIKRKSEITKNILKTYHNLNPTTLKTSDGFKGCNIKEKFLTNRNRFYVKPEDIERTRKICTIKGKKRGKKNSTKRLYIIFESFLLKFFFFFFFHPLLWNSPRHEEWNAFLSLSILRGL